MADVIAELHAAIQRGEPVALATVVSTSSGAPARPGFKLLVHPDGTMTGNVGGGELEEHLRCAALESLAGGAPSTVQYSLTETGPGATGMLCGGEVTAFVEPYLPQPVLVIVGGGHIGQPLAQLAAVLDYEVQVVDPRGERATLPTLAPATLSRRSAVVIITENHESDEAALRDVLLMDDAVGYVGMIGSRRKVDAIFGHLRASGVPEPRLAQVHAPIGLDLGGARPAEIALAILAEVELARHGGSPQPRSARTQSPS